MDSTQTDGAAAPQPFTCSQIKKEVNDGDSTGEHLHRFTVKRSTDPEEYLVHCDQPRTVLQAIQSRIKCSDENIVIQRGKKDKEYIVATHFPCSCINNDEFLIVLPNSKKVEEAQDQHHETIHSRDHYSVFYIDTKGGINAKTKVLFRSNAVKQFKYLCVYGEKGITVEEALKRDGRFNDDLSDYTLSDNDNPTCITAGMEKVEHIHQKKFKIRLPKKKRADNVKPKPDKKQVAGIVAGVVAGGATGVVAGGATGVVAGVVAGGATGVVAGAAKQRGISVRAALRGTDNEEIYQRLREQFPGLKEWMESRFPGDSYQKALELKKEDFGKIQQSFTEVHRVKKLLKLGESVCKVVVENVCEGTGFVLFDKFILTNAHLVEDCAKGQKVFVLFNYEDPEPNENYFCFQAADFYTNNHNELDYAILELNPECYKSNKSNTTYIPAGLLENFGPLPQTGEACIIGHPAGGVKQMDPTCIIEIEKREQAVNYHLHPYKDSLFIVQSINHLIRKQGIENIMMGGSKAETGATYNTFMYHGSSGAPVFDAQVRVFGLHTRGFTYGFPKHTESVIEFAQPLLTIVQHFVSVLKEKQEERLLKKVEEVTRGNPFLEEILNPKTTHTPEPMIH